MTTLRFISGEAALHDFLHGIMSDTETALDDRNINASGKLKASNRTEVSNGPSWSTGTFSALAHWTKAGSGSPPGTKAKVDDLKQWALDKGLANNDRAALRLGNLVSRKIEKEGSKDHREGNSNVYSDSIDANLFKIPDMLLAFARDINDPVATEFRKAFA